jgi:hypothetical protein
MAESDPYRVPFPDGLRTRKAQTEYVEFIHAFLFRFAFIATIFLLAMLIAYLAR